MKTSRDMIYEVVKDNNKKRFEIQKIYGKEYIRAVQGHTLTEVKNEEALEEIPNIYDYPTIIHGTYFEAWEFIKKTGLNRMSRNCIHFAIGDNNDKNVISGMRGNVQLIVEIDAPLCVANGIKMYISTNKVVLSDGVNGAIEPKYFKRVYSKTGEIIQSTLYQLAIVPFYTIEQINFNKELVLKSISLIDLNSGNQEFEIVNDNKTNDFSICWNAFFDTFLNKKYNTRSTILVLFSSISLLYKNFISKVKLSNIKCLSLMSEYIELISDIDEVNKYTNSSFVIKEM